MLFRYFLATNVLQVTARLYLLYFRRYGRFLVCRKIRKFGRKVLHIDTMNHAENLHCRLKNGRLTAILVLGKMSKLNRFIIFCPVFAMFSMIILSNIFENKRFLD